LKLTLVGTGLIGSAFALAAKKAGVVTEVCGLDPNPEHAQTALDRGIVDALVTDVPADADLVLLAPPATQIAGWVARLAQHSGVLLDVGSVKGVLIDQLRADHGSVPSHYVPCHPIAGLERNGPGAATVDLFANHSVVLTPLADTDAQALALATSCWEQVGAKVELMDPWEHDITFATTSHLPHLTAFAYMQQVSSEQLAYAAGGFRDFSRIAAADPDMWTAILQLNAKAVRAALADLQGNLTRLDTAIASGDWTEIHNLIAKSQGRRQEFDLPGSGSDLGKGGAND
jgi:prephenate dehydrogenase